MQHAPDKGTVKAYAYTTGCDPMGCKEWGIWSNASWTSQMLQGILVTERPEATQLCDRLFQRLCKLLFIVGLFDGIIAPPPLQRIAFDSLMEPLLLPHIQAQGTAAAAVAKARRVVDCLPASWFKFGTPECAPIDSK